MAALFVSSGGEVHAVPLHQAPMLDAASVPKYRAPLLVPTAMPRSSTGAVDRYVIGVRQFRQQVLPHGLPRTTVWGYGSETRHGTYGSPSLTIEARAGRPVEVTWVNGLVNGTTGRYLPHLLPVDPTLHWANPAGGEDGRDMHPEFTSTPGPYRGPVPAVVHLHGGHTDEESDGFPESWFLPNARGIPRGYARVGSMYDSMSAEYAHHHGPTWRPGSARAHYGNDQAAGTMWFHDHTLGMTRVNVYAGPAGFYLLRGGAHDLEPGVLPGPARHGDGTTAGRPTRSRSSSRTAPSARTAACSTPTRASTSTGSPGPTCPTRTSHRSSTRSSSATPSWSTAAPGPTSRSSGGATACGCSTGAAPGS